MQMPVLHPGLKLEYFRTREWEDSWIKTAKDMVYDEYNLHYRDSATVVDATPDEPTVQYILHYIRCAGLIKTSLGNN
jgi:hypothetical protein